MKISTGNPCGNYKDIDKLKEMVHNVPSLHFRFNEMKALLSSVNSQSTGRA